MSEALKVLNNIRTLRAQARETDLETLEEMLEKLSVIVDERREEEQAVLKEKEQRQANLPPETVRGWYRSCGITFSGWFH